jgi:hypothetical protein
LVFFPSKYYSHARRRFKQDKASALQKISLAFIFSVRIMRCLAAAIAAFGSSLPDLSLARIQSRLSKRILASSGFSG